LFIVLSLFTIYLFALGYLATPSFRSPDRLLAQLGLAIGAGILVNYCLMLTGQTITRVFIAGTILALWGGLRFYADLRIRSDGRITEYKTSLFAVWCIICLLAVYYIQILTDPLSRWDARSIWFFHARMIWAEGALRQSAGWNHPSIGFSNPDYPKLVPAIAAQLAYAKGYWNEFLPKGSLFVMLVPLTLWVFSFYQKRLSFVLLVVTFFFSLGGLLWIGYMDGYLAMYSAVALLLFGRYLSERRDTDLYSGMCALGISASLKYEGLLFGVCAITALLFIGPEHLEFRLSNFAKRIRNDSLFAKVLLVSIAPPLMWTIYKKAWGLQSDLARDPLDGFSRLWGRLFDGVTPLYLLNYLTMRSTAIWMVAGLLMVIMIFSVHQGLKLHRGALLAATTSGLYFCGLYVVYLSTPYNILDFYLSAAGTRTMITASMALLVAVFFLLRSLEVHEGSV
jgi:hypothetical protein